MKRNSSILTLVLIGLAGTLVVVLLVAAAFVAFFRISSTTVSASEPGQAIVETVVLPVETQALSGEEVPDSEKEPSIIETLPQDGAVTPEPGSGVIAPPGFNAFVDDQLHFGIAYPADWEEGQRYLEYSRLFFEKSTDPDGIGPLPKLYVTFIPLDDSLAQGSYGFMSNESIRSFMALAVGEAQPLEPDAVLAEYITYTRLPDRAVSGWQALVIENDRVWEAPPETIERRALIVTEAGTLILGTFYERPEELALFEQALDTFQFMP